MLQISTTLTRNACILVFEGEYFDGTGQNFSKRIWLNRWPALSATPYQSSKIPIAETKT